MKVQVAMSHLNAMHFLLVYCFHCELYEELQDDHRDLFQEEQKDEFLILQNIIRIVNAVL